MKKIVYISFILLSFATLFGCGSKHSDPQKDPETNAPTADNNSPSQSPGDDTTATSDAGSTSTSNNPPPPPPVETLDTCLKACTVKYPDAAKLDQQLDQQCMLGTCESVCNGIGSSGKNYPPDPPQDGGSNCDTAGAGAWSISTPSSQCSSCLNTTPACCSLWIQLYGPDHGGQQLSACAGACYSKFPNK